jgi:L-asparagine transporter-like permease
MSIEVVPVLVAGIAATAVGVIWYVLFAGALKRIRPLSPAEEEQAQRQMPVAFVVGLLLTLLMAVVLFHFVTISDAYPANAIVNGLVTALLAYLGFVLPVQTTHILFGNYGELETKLKLLGINTGGQLVSLLTMGVVIGWAK